MELHSLNPPCASESMPETPQSPILPYESAPPPHAVAAKLAQFPDADSDIQLSLADTKEELSLATNAALAACGSARTRARAKPVAELALPTKEGRRKMDILRELGRDGLATNPSNVRRESEEDAGPECTLIGTEHISTVAFALVWALICARGRR